MLCILLTGPQELLQVVEGGGGEATTGNKPDKDKDRDMWSRWGEIPKWKGRHFKAGRVSCHSWQGSPLMAQLYDEQTDMPPA